MADYWDKDDRPVSLDEWIGLTGDEAYRRIGSTHVGDRCWVSTVWLGIGDLPFETCIFAEGHALDHEVFRTRTEPEAEAMHAAIVKRVK